jgi:hypothetical protein
MNEEEEQRKAIALKSREHKLNLRRARQLDKNDPNSVRNRLVGKKAPAARTLRLPKRNTFRASKGGSLSPDRAAATALRLARTQANIGDGHPKATRTLAETQNATPPQHKPVESTGGDFDAAAPRRTDVAVVDHHQARLSTANDYRGLAQAYTTKHEADNQDGKRFQGKVRSVLV